MSSLACSPISSVEDGESAVAQPQGCVKVTPCHRCYLRALCALSAASQDLRSPLKSVRGWKRPHCWQNLRAVSQGPRAGVKRRTCWLYKNEDMPPAATAPAVVHHQAAQLDLVLPYLQMLPASSTGFAFMCASHTLWRLR